MAEQAGIHEYLKDTRGKNDGTNWKCEDAQVVLNQFYLKCRLISVRLQQQRLTAPLCITVPRFSGQLHGRYALGLADVNKDLLKMKTTSPS